MVLQNWRDKSTRQEEGAEKAKAEGEEGMEVDAEKPEKDKPEDAS